MHCLPDKQAENYFNSRPREGCDSAFAYRNRHTAALTHAPARGATTVGQCLLLALAPSTRAPREGERPYLPIVYRIRI